MGVWGHEVPTFIIMIDLNDLIEKEAELREKAKASFQMQRFFEDAANEVKKVRESIQRELNGLDVKLQHLETETKQRLT
jgi:hypothetical protein